MITKITHVFTTRCVPSNSFMGGEEIYARHDGHGLTQGCVYRAIYCYTIDTTEYIDLIDDNGEIHAFLSSKFDKHRIDVASNCFSDEYDDIIEAQETIAKLKGDNHEQVQRNERPPYPQVTAE